MNALSFDKGQVPERAGSVGSSARILLAAADPALRDYVKRVLGSRCTIEAVEDGPQALAAAENNPPDLVLTDTGESGLDGVELLRRLREGERTRAVPVVMLAARQEDEAELEGREEEPDDYLMKPFSARELAARVRNQLDLARLRREHEHHRAGLLEVVRFGEELVAILANDFRSPLDAIVTASDLLLRREASDRTARPIQRICASAERMTGMIEQVLDFTRASIGDVVRAQAEERAR